eukprot:jgi/Ulvmu1/5787/UM025_0041.1
MHAAVPCTAAAAAVPSHLEAGTCAAAQQSSRGNGHRAWSVGPHGGRWSDMHASSTAHPAPALVGLCSGIFGTRHGDEHTAHAFFFGGERGLPICWAGVGAA